MTKEQIELFTPVFDAIKNGLKVQIYDTLNLNYHARGWWKTVDNWGFGHWDLSLYRIKNNDETFTYFKEQPQYRIQRDLDEPNKWVENIEYYS